MSEDNRVWLRFSYYRCTAEPSDHHIVSHEVDVSEWPTLAVRAVVAALQADERNRSGTDLATALGADVALGGYVVEYLGVFRQRTVEERIVGYDRE